jgi:two-component system sensor histidine kinase AlgZ
MHPILTNMRRLGRYLGAWGPLAALLAYLMVVTAGMAWREAAVMSFPLCLLYALLCLAAWYPCYANPWERAGIPRLVEVHLAGALVASGAWIAAAELLAHGLATTGYYPEIVSRMPRIIPLLAGTGVLFYLLSVNFYYVLLAVEASQEAEARAMEARMLTRDAELRALKAQVNPHFLFNSLNSISALTGSDPAKAREMCILLGEFLRRTLGLGEKSAIPLEEEMSLIRAFLAVEKIRFGERLRMEEKVAKECLGFNVPPLLLQPLVENAVGHGIANMVEGGTIRLCVKCDDGNLDIEVENPFDPEAPVRRRSGVGLANVKQRLAARYGERARLRVRSDQGRFSVWITIPAERAENSA